MASIDYDIQIAQHNVTVLEAQKYLMQIVETGTVEIVGKSMADLMVLCELGWAQMGNSFRVTDKGYAEYARLKHQYASPDVFTVRQLEAIRNGTATEAHRDR